MKKILLPLVALLFICSSNIFALEKDKTYFYINADAGIPMGVTKIKNEKTQNKETELASAGFLGNAGIGILHNRLRIEAIYQGRAEVSKDIDKKGQKLGDIEGTLNMQAGMANIYYDIIDLGIISIYIGGGAGVNAYELTLKNKGELDVNKYKEDGTSAIFGGYAGVTLKIDHLFIDGGVNYYYVDKPETDSITPKVSVRFVF